MTRPRPSIVAISLAAALLLVIVALVAWRTSPAPASDALGILGPTRVARGATLYATNCASCHGVKGEGEPNWKTPNADITYPAPPHDATGHSWHHSDKLLLEIIRDGGARYESATFKSRMPAWGDRLTDEEIRALVAYVKTLWGPEERRFQTEASARDPLLDAVP